ncbi:hypothetical protein AGMMS50225_04730 [Betaproteobacteria bacterium]|nr:hypothetical protein AGMMS50225_04730 [Betaproteobacteria bacterium]
MLNRLKIFDVGLWLLPLLLLWILLAAQPLGAKTASGQNSGVVGVSGGVALLEAAPRLDFGGLGSESASGAPHAAKGGVQVTEKGIARVESHVAQFGNDPANAVMIERLRAGQTTPQDLTFYFHELKESSFMRQGLSARDAHLGTLKWQGIEYKAGYEAKIYHPDAIRAGGYEFSPAARKAAGIE